MKKNIETIEGYSVKHDKFNYDTHLPELIIERRNSPEEAFTIVKDSIKFDVLIQALPYGVGGVSHKGKIYVSEKLYGSDKLFILLHELAHCLRLDKYGIDSENLIGKDYDFILADITREELIANRFASIYYTILTGMIFYNMNVDELAYIQQAKQFSTMNKKQYDLMVKTVLG